MFKDCEITAAEAIFRSIDEANAVVMPRGNGLVDYNPDSSICAREDLCARRNNDVKWLFVRHPSSELTWLRREL